jgi:hypothetical protein
MQQDAILKRLEGSKVYEVVVELSSVYITANRQSTSSSWYRASLWGPWPDLSFSSFFFFWLTITFILFPMTSSLTRKWVCSLECLHSLVRSLTTSNHTLPSHPRLCFLSVASYDSQGLRWKYSNPPPHGECELLATCSSTYNPVRTSQEAHSVSIK